MGRKTPQTFAKRRREMDKQQKRQAKLADRLVRNANRKAARLQQDQGIVPAQPDGSMPGATHGVEPVPGTPGLPEAVPAGPAAAPVVPSVPVAPAVRDEGDHDARRVPTSDRVPSSDPLATIEPKTDAGK